GLEFVLGGHREVGDMVTHHAALGRMLAEQLSLSVTVQQAIVASYEWWDGRGWPGKLRGESIPVAARIALVAEYVEGANRVGGLDAVRKLAGERRGGHFDPRLCDLLRAEGETLLSGLDDVAAWDAVIGAEPALAPVVSGDGLDAALTAIANFVDMKSPYF